MYPFRNWLFLSCAILYVVNKFLLPFLSVTSFPYLNDVACLPVILTLALFLQQKLGFQKASATLNKTQIIFTVLYVAVLFEGILPAFSVKYTRDYWDVLAYVGGGFLFYLFGNPKTAILEPETI